MNQTKVKLISSGLVQNRLICNIYSSACRDLCSVFGSEKSGLDCSVTKSQQGPLLYIGRTLYGVDRNYVICKLFILDDASLFSVLLVF